MWIHTLVDEHGIFSYGIYNKLAISQMTYLKIQTWQSVFATIYVKAMTVENSVSDSDVIGVS